MINYAYSRKWRWANTAHNEATYCTVPEADWERRSSRAKVRRMMIGWGFSSIPVAAVSPNDQRVCWRCMKLTYIFENVVPPFPDLANVSCSLRGWWCWGAGNFCWQKGDESCGRPPSVVLHEDGPCSQMKTLTGGCGRLLSRSHGSIISASVSAEPLFIRLIFNLFYLFIWQRQNSWAVLLAVFWGH